jgi:CheY-like chemotaxis protein
MLKGAGHEVVLAAGGWEGLRLFRAGRADVVVTDLVMPNQDGIETIVALKREFPDVAIVAMLGRVGKRRDSFRCQVTRGGCRA